MMKTWSDSGIVRGQDPRERRRTRWLCLTVVVAIALIFYHSPLVKINILQRCYRPIHDDVDTQRWESFNWDAVSGSLLSCSPAVPVPISVDIRHQRSMLDSTGYHTVRYVPLRAVRLRTWDVTTPPLVRIFPHIILIFQLRQSVHGMLAFTPRTTDQSRSMLLKTSSSILASRLFNARN